MSLLTALADDLLDQICTGADTETLRALMRTCARLQRHALLHGVGRWANPRFPIQPEAVRALGVLARAQPDLIPLVRHRLCCRGAVRFVDAVMLDGNCCPGVVVRDFIERFGLGLLAEIAPGICFDMHLHRTPASRLPSNGALTFARITSQNSANWTFVRHNAPQICRGFGVAAQAASIRVRVRPEIDAVLRQFTDQARERGYVKDCPARRLAWARVFESRVFQLHRGPKQAMTRDSIATVLLRELSGSGLLADPVVLLSLLRIGIRFEVCDYLEHCPAQTAGKFAAVAPFLSPWNFNARKLQDRMERLSPESDPDHLRVLCALHPARTWLSLPDAAPFVLNQFLLRQRFTEFGRLFPHLVANMRPSSGKWIAAFLVTAVQCRAPTAIADLLLAHAALDFQYDCMDRVNVSSFTRKDLQVVEYVRERLYASHDQVKKRLMREHDALSNLKSARRKANH